MEKELASTSKWLPLTIDEQERFLAEQRQTKRKARLLEVRKLDKEAATGLWPGLPRSFFPTLN